MRPLDILKHHARVIHVLGFPLRQRQHQPRQRFRGAFFQHARKKRLRMPNESDLGARQSQLFPKQSRDSITLRAAGRIAVSARRQHQTTALWRHARDLKRPAQLIGERAHHQRMTGIDIVMMDHRVRIATPRFRDQPPQSLTLADVEIKHRRDHESLVAGFDRQIIDRRQPHIRIESRELGRTPREPPQLETTPAPMPGFAASGRWR